MPLTKDFRPLNPIKILYIDLITISLANVAKSTFLGSYFQEESFLKVLIESYEENTMCSG